MSDLLGDVNVSMSYVENLPCLALIDTGSQVSTISEGFFNEYLSHCPLQQLDEILKIEGAGGQGVPFQGYIEVNSISRPDQWCGKWFPNLDPGCG
jgi:hypothetical protein